MKKLVSILLKVNITVRPCNINRTSLLRTESEAFAPSARVLIKQKYFALKTKKQEWLWSVLRLLSEVNKSFFKSLQKFTFLFWLLLIFFIVVIIIYSNIKVNNMSS